MKQILKINPEVDLVLERKVNLSAKQIWKAWSDPQLLMKWFCPNPWKVTECEMDLRPGGAFYTLMSGPEGERIPNTGCFLEIIPEKKLVWTSALLPEFRPIPVPENGISMPFTVTIILEPTEGGTNYFAHVSHKDANDKLAHEEMGFHEGWGIAVDQLVALFP